MPAPSSNKLTEANLTRQQANIVPNDNHALNTIKQEQAQLYQQAAHGHFGGPANALQASSAGLTQQQAAASQLNSAVSMYAPIGTSTASPYERFCLASPTNGPWFPGARNAMNDMGVSPGSFANVNQRISAADAVRTAAVGNGNAGRSCQASIVATAAVSTEGSRTVQV